MAKIVISVVNQLMKNIKNLAPIQKMSLYFTLYNTMNRSSKLYPVQNKPTQSQVIQALKKLNELNENIRQNLRSNLDPRINAYRQVRGDGNCFFRAFAFSYITNKKVIYHDDLFNYLNKVSLEACRPQTIPKQFLPFYKDQLLKEILKLFWQKQYNSYLKATCNAHQIVNYKRALANLLLNNPYFDFIIIIYFRAVCLGAFQSMKGNIKDYLKGTEQEQIKSWGQQSEGLVLDCMNRFFQINIFIFELRKNEVVKYQYQKSFQSNIGKNNVYLLYANSHYDMLQINEDPLAEYQDEKIDAEYYSESSSRIYVQGYCIECNKTKQVSNETSLCRQCEFKSIKSLDTFQKDRFIEGYCSQCNKISRNISEQLLMCSNCLQQLQYASIPSQQFKNVEPSIIRQINRDYDIKQPAYQSPVKNSKLRDQNQLSYQQSYISSLNEKLESKISRQEKAKIKQQEKDKFRGKQTVMKAKIQFRPQKIHCIKCKKMFTTLKEAQQKDALCPECENKYNISKTSKIKQQLQKSSLKSGTKKEQSCQQCRNSFPTYSNGLCKVCNQYLSKRGIIRQ